MKDAKRLNETNKVQSPEAPHTTYDTMMSRILAAIVLLVGTNAQVPANDKCIEREKLQPFEPVFGNVTEANFDYNNQGVCGPRSDRPSVWYEVRGRGADVTVKVCTNNDVITDFGVFSECNSQLCVGAPDQLLEPSNCEEDEYTNFTWFAKRNLQYFVHVRSDVVDGVGSNFTIVFEDASLDGPVEDDEVANGKATGQLGSAGAFVSLRMTIVAIAFSGVALLL